MLDFIKNSWAENNKKLDVALKKLLDKKGCSIDYFDLFKVQIDTVVNPYFPRGGGRLDTDKILVYVPTRKGPELVFVIGVAPGPDHDFWINDLDIYKTYVQYGSCSVCDTLMNLFDTYKYNDDRLVKGLKSVCLHMLERMKQIQGML